MAELPRYQPTGVLFADVPRMDFANVREEARAAQGLSQALDRISDFAFKRAVKQAELEGKQWAYQNPVTPEQIKAAQESGQPLNLPDGGTYFGAAARDVQAAVLRGDLELQARGEFARLSAAVDAGLVTDIKDVQAGLTAPIEGFAKLLAQVDPDEAAKFRASMATAGNAVYQNATKRISDLYIEGRKASVAQAIDDSGVILSDIFRTEMEPVALNQRVGLERQRVFDLAAATGSVEFIRTSMSNFDKNVVKVRTAVLTNYFGSSEFAGKPGEMLAKLRDGSAGKYAMVWSAMDEDAKNDIIDKVLTRVGNDAQLRDREAKLEKEANRDKGLRVRNSFWKGEIGVDEAINTLLNLGDISPEEIKAFRAGEDDLNNGELIDRLESLIAKSIVGENQIEEYAQQRAITWKQSAKLKAQARDVGSKMSNALQFINFSLGISDPLAAGFRNERARAAEVKTQLLQEAADAEQKGEPFNPMVRARALVSSRLQQDDVKLLEQDRARLREKLKQAKILYSEDLTEDDLVRAGVDANTRKTIMRILKSIRGD